MESVRRPKGGSEPARLDLNPPLGSIGVWGLCEATQKLRAFRYTNSCRFFDHSDMMWNYRVNYPNPGSLKVGKLHKGKNNVISSFIRSLVLNTSTLAPLVARTDLFLKVDHCRLNLIYMFLTFPAVKNESPNLGPTCS